MNGVVFQVSVITMAIRAGPSDPPLLADKWARKERT